MKMMSTLLALAALSISSTGCCCCGDWFRTPTPVAAACPPGPACDPCTTAPVTYGTAPMTPYTPAPQW